METVLARKDVPLLAHFVLPETNRTSVVSTQQLALAHCNLVEYQWSALLRHVRNTM